MTLDRKELAEYTIRDMQRHLVATGKDPETVDRDLVIEECNLIDEAIGSLFLASFKKVESEIK